MDAYEDTGTLSRSGTHAPVDSTADSKTTPPVGIHSVQREPITPIQLVQVWRVELHGLAPFD